MKLCGTLCVCGCAEGPTPPCLGEDVARVGLACSSSVVVTRQGARPPWLLPVAPGELLVAGGPIPRFLPVLCSLPPASCSHLLCS